MKLCRAKIETAMARKQWNLSDLKNAVSIPESTLTRAFYGAGTRPAVVGQIADVLGVDVEDIIERSEGE